MSPLKIITIFSLMAFNLGAFSLNKECAAYLDLNDHLNCPERIGFNFNYLSTMVINTVRNFQIHHKIGMMREKSLLTLFEPV